MLLQDSLAINRTLTVLVMDRTGSIEGEGFSFSLGKKSQFRSGYKVGGTGRTLCASKLKSGSCLTIIGTKGFAPERGEPILVELRKSEGVVGLDAAMTIKEWRKGNLRFS